MGIPNQTPYVENPSKETAPQNGYRSYMPEQVYQDKESWNSPQVQHERLSNQEMIARASGGITSMDAELTPDNSYNSDGK